MSVISIFVVALVLANFTGIDGQYDRVVCPNMVSDAIFASFLLDDCVDVKHTECTVCPAHWYVECPSGYVHKTYRSCGFLKWGCQLECVREWKVCPRCDESCKDCPIPRYIKPTPRPTKEPTKPTPRPTKEPTPRPTHRPTREPTGRPTVTPSRPPTRFPTAEPTDYPTYSPTDSPTSSPTGAPSQFPTESPTLAPTNSPYMSPTSAPTIAPTNAPTMEPSVPSPEQVCAAVSHKAACKVTPGCYFGDKADGPCSLFSGVCENITNRKTCKAAEPCVSKKGRCLSKSFTVTNHQ